MSLLHENSALKIVTRYHANNKNVKKSINYFRFNLNYVRSGSLYFRAAAAAKAKATENKIHGRLTRLFSTSTNNMPLSNFKVFTNADLDKLDIFEYVKGKSGIYMWTNKLNNKNYIGSSVSLRRRLLEYYNVNRLLNEKSMPIYTALLKYGYQNFSLTILEICSIDSLMSREKYYFDVYSPEYNILKTPGSPDRGSGWKHSEATIENMSIAVNKRNKSLEYITKVSEAQPKNIKIEVTNIETNTSMVYNAIRAAARALDLDRRYIENYIYLNEDKPVLGKYTFKLISSEKSNTNPVVNTQKTSKKLKVTNVDLQKVTVYPSIGAAARELGLRQASISLYLKENRTKPFKGLYLFELV